MAGKGGLQRPNNPAPASGPGRLSRRTDGGPAQAMRDLPNAAYGEQQTFQEDQRGAPMAMSGGAPMDMGGPQDASAELIPFGAPTQRPDESGQSGATLGPGLGPESLGIQDPAQALNQEDLEKIADMLPLLEYMANRPGAMPSTRQLVRRLKSTI